MCSAMNPELIRLKITCMKWIVLALSFFSLNHLSAQVAPRLDWPHGVGKMSSASGDFRDIGIDLDVLGNRHAAVTAEVQADVDPRPDETIHAGAGRSPVSSGKDVHFTAVATYKAGKASVVPNEPTGLVATAGYNAAHIAFTAPTNDGGSAIINYEYKLNDDSWVALSPVSYTHLTLPTKRIV